MFSATLLVCVWDTDEERDQWTLSDLPTDLHMEFRGLHTWCVDESAGWARGNLGIPVWHKQAVCSHSFVSGTAAPSDASNPAKRARYASVSPFHATARQARQTTVPANSLKEAHGDDVYRKVLDVSIGLALSFK